MVDRKQALSVYLDHAHAVLNYTLDQLTPEQWEMPVQEGDAHWTARQVLSHLCDSVRGMTGQSVRIVAGEQPVPPDFDLNRWNRRMAEKMNDKSVAELRQMLTDYQKAAANALESFTDAQLDTVGRHSSLNMMSVEAIFHLIGEHEIDHARGIAEALKFSFSEA